MDDRLDEGGHWGPNPTNDRPDPATCTAVWEAIDNALHDALLPFDKDVLQWLAYRTETTSLVQDKAYDVLEFIDPVVRAANDGISRAQARKDIARDVLRAKVRSGRT